MGSHYVKNIPWLPILVIGTAVAFYVGEKKLLVRQENLHFAHIVFSDIQLVPNPGIQLLGIGINYRIKNARFIDLVQWVADTRTMLVPSIDGPPLCVQASAAQ